MSKDRFILMTSKNAGKSTQVACSIAASYALNHLGKDIEIHYFENQEIERQLKESLEREEKLARKVKALKNALSITLVSYSDFADDEEDEEFIENCRKLIK